MTIYQMAMGFSFVVYLLLLALGAQLGAPFWYFIVSIPVSPVLSLGFVLLTAYIGIGLEDRARAKRRAAAAARRSQGL